MSVTNAPNFSTMADGENEEVDEGVPEQKPEEEEAIEVPPKAQTSEDVAAPEQEPSDEVIGDIPKKEKRKSLKKAASKRKSKRESSSKPPDPPESKGMEKMHEEINQRYSLGRVSFASQPNPYSRDVEVGRKNSKVLSSRTSSVLDSSDDPFATREGKTLLWRDINMVLAAKKEGEKDQYLLEGVWGGVPQRKTTAIMGPSGK